MGTTNNIINLLESGLQAETLRRKTIANNVANLETPGYRAVGVKFEELVSKALNSTGSQAPLNLEPELFKPMETPVKSNGNDVSLEDQVGKMVKNDLRHTTYIRLLNKKYKQMELAVNTK